MAPSHTLILFIQQVLCIAGHEEEFNTRPCPQEADWLVRYICKQAQVKWIVDIVVFHGSS